MFKLLFWAALIYVAYRYFAKNRLKQGNQHTTIHHHHYRKHFDKAKEDNGDFIDYEEIK